MKQLETTLGHENLKVSIKFKTRKTVASAFIKFENMLFLLGLTPHEDKKLMLKFEVDQNPPSGYKTESTMLTDEFFVMINHFDKPSLFAGKLHALLCRRYAKGRDYYDFLWFVGQKIKPNYEQLNQAIIQTEGNDLNVDGEKLIQLLTQKFKDTDFKKVSIDVEPFLQDHTEERFFQEQIFLNLLTTDAF